jgi:CHAD domain-containing protein
MAKAKLVTGINPEATTAHNALLITRTRMEELEQWSRYVDESQRVHELHDLRIAAKRLRYTLEQFVDVLPPECGDMLEEVKRVQEELGVVHDTDVMIALVRRCQGPARREEEYEHPKQQPVNRAIRLETKEEKQEVIILSRDLTAILAGASERLTHEEQRGLEKLVSTLQQQRNAAYETFRQHWHRIPLQHFHTVLCKS